MSKFIISLILIVFLFSCERNISEPQAAVNVEKQKCDTTYTIFIDSLGDYNEYYEIKCN